jgi:hypothetical protein
MQRLAAQTLRHLVVLVFSSFISSSILMLLNLSGSLNYSISEWIEVFKFFVLINIVSFIIILPGYLVFLCAIRLPAPWPQLHPWDVVVFCFLFLVVASRFFPIGDEVNIMLFRGADHLFAALNLCLFVLMNGSLIRSRRLRQVGSSPI